MRVINVQKDTCNLSEGIWLSDIQSVKFYPYNKENGRWEENPSCMKKLSPKLIPCSNSFMSKKSDIVGISTSVKNHVFMYSTQKDILEGYDYYPVSPNPYDNLSSKTVYSADIDIKPDKSYLVLAYLLFKSVCIVPLDKPEMPLFLGFKDTPFPQLEVNDRKPNLENIRVLPLQYVDIYTTDNFIYALYANKMNNELENHSHEALKEKEGMSVHIFKWDGTAFCSLNLDRIINCFCVDEINNIIYGLDPTGDENAILYRFPVPKNIINKFNK
jgi:hypothetical protein